MTDPLPEGPPALMPLTASEITRYERVGKIYGMLKVSVTTGDWAITKANGLAGVEFIWAGRLRDVDQRFAYTVRYDQLEADERAIVNRLAQEIINEWHRKIRP